MMININHDKYIKNKLVISFNNNSQKAKKRYQSS